ncbi:MAG: hypothetical protein ACLT76_01225 [Clostridium fessum]
MSQFVLTSIHLPVTITAALFYNLQLHILFLNPIQLLAVRTECKPGGFATIPFT